jgi:hypothetical protein
MLLGAACRANADPISFHLTSIQITTMSGATATFDGTVTNDSGVALNASDFFFNFLGFDPVSVNPIQDLGVTTDFLIPNGTTTSVVALFDVMLGAVPAGSISRRAPVHGELLNWAKITMPHATVPPTSDRPTANAGLAGLFGAERFEKELLVERRLGVRAALKRQEKKEK